MSIRSILCFRFKRQSDGNIHGINFFGSIWVDCDFGGSVAFTNNNAKGVNAMRNKTL